MELRDARILLTGASSGIGRATAFALARRGSRLVLAGRNEHALADTRDAIREKGGEAWTVAADLTEPGRAARLAEEAVGLLGGLDVLINNAGISHFGLFARMPDDAIAALVETNVTAPLLLTRAVLPELLAQGSGRIVNVGSVFGAIGFPCFSAYSASKFALRGFSEALRRELDGTGVRIIHVAPRATRTPLNGPAASAMAQEVKMPMDPPERVAERIALALARDLAETTLGRAEGFFSRLNGLLPRVADSALAKQGRVMKRFAAKEPRPEPKGESQG